MQDNMTVQRVRPQSIQTMKNVIQRQQIKIETLRSQKRRLEERLAYALFPFSGQAPDGYRKTQDEVKAVIKRHMSLVLES